MLILLITFIGVAFNALLYYTNDRPYRKISIRHAKKLAMTGDNQDLLDAQEVMFHVDNGRVYTRNDILGLKS